MTTHFHWDVETRSAVDLKRTGADVYARHPSTDLWCIQYAVNDDEPELWVPDMDVPPEFYEVVNDPDWESWAHNHAFESNILRHILKPKYGFPDIPVEKTRCTMAMAYAMSLPGGLGNCAAALGSEFDKDMSGHRLMLQMAKPRNQYDDGTIEWWDDPERKAKLYEYCADDVRAERGIGKRLLALQPHELEIYHLDQKINNRGIFVDIELCEAAKEVVRRTADRLDARMRELTNGDVSACTNVNQITSFLNKHGIETNSIAKAALAELMTRDDIDPVCMEVMELRQEAAKASVAKIVSLMECRSPDGRARGLTQYHAAHTGRWGGRRFQPHNIKRPDDKASIPAMIDLILDQDDTLLELMYGPPLNCVGDCIRGMARAAPGYRLISADFSNIEGRVTAWLADEAWKLDAFRAFDAGTGPDIYKLAYSTSFGVPLETVTDSDRQIGKVEELALGFGGGVGAFEQMAKGYGVNIRPHYDRLAAMAPEVHDRAVENWESWGSTRGVEMIRWLAAEMVKLAWRDQHPRVCGEWKALERAAFQALKEPGVLAECGKVRFLKNGSFLFCRLPSGRRLAYPYPELRLRDMPWEGTDGEKQRRWTLHYKHVDSTTGKWKTTHTYGGKLFENVVQAIARDVLAEAMLRVDPSCPIVLHVHDEIVCEVPAEKATSALLAAFEAEMSRIPETLSGLPVSAEGWIGDRYRK